MANRVVEEFREAWLSLEDEDFASRLARESLEASAAGIPELEAALFELKRAYQAELDLHLSGESVTGHSTQARKFADLVRGIADAVKEIQKSEMGRQRLSSTLLVSSPLPGSVRLVLSAAPPLAMQTDIDAAQTETAESAALIAVTTLLERAEEDSGVPDSTVLDGMTAVLPAKARTAMLRVAESVSSAGWRIEGDLRRAGRSTAHVRIGVAGARRLESALRERIEEIFILERNGVIDGQRRSLGAMWFIPDGEAPLEAAVLDTKLFDEVAAHAANDVRVHVRLRATVVHPPSTSAATRRSYSLLAIESFPDKEVPLVD